MYINSFVTYLKNEKRYSKHTVKSYNTDLIQFKAFCKNSIKDFNLLTVEANSIRKWIVFLLENNISARTVNRKIVAIKSFYKYLYQQNIINDIPTKKVISPRMSKKIPSFLDNATINFLLDDFDFENNFEGKRDKIIILIFYHTGIRVSELVYLKINDIDLYNCNIKVLGKRNKERIIPFGEELRSYFKKYIEEREKILVDNNYLILTNKYKPTYPEFIYKTVKKYLSYVTTLEKKSPHVLRHTFATHLLNNGADINAIKELLGHASLAATQIYTHTSFDKLKKIYNKAHPRA